MRFRLTTIWRSFPFLNNDHSSCIAERKPRYFRSRKVAYQWVHFLTWFQPCHFFPECEYWSLMIIFSHSIWLKELLIFRQVHLFSLFLRWQFLTYTPIRLIFFQNLFIQWKLSRHTAKKSVFVFLLRISIIAHFFEIIFMMQNFEQN